MNFFSYEANPFNNQYDLDNDNDNDNPYYLSIQENLHESGNLLNPYSSNNSSKNLDDINSSENNINIFNDNTFQDNLIFNNENQDGFKEDEKNSKFMLYLKNNKFVKDNNILEKEKMINDGKKDFELKINNVINNIKCKGCSSIPNEFFICSLCNSIFCENCLGRVGTKNSNFKFCIYCNKLIKSKDHFIKLPIFNKILSYINSIKGNNENLFNNKIKENLDNNVIYCSEDIHNNNMDDILNNNIIEIKNESYSNYEMKATYFCMECLRPFCSDCILKYKKESKNKNNNNNITYDNNKNNSNNDNLNNINNDIKQLKHNHNHPIYKIELLKDIGIFDLLYEKGKSEKIISDLESINQHINDKIENINLKKENMLLFLDYIKNIYIDKVDEIINRLKSINQERSEKIKLIKQKNEDLSNFFKNFKTQKDIKYIKDKKIINNIQNLLSDFISFHKIPYEIKKKSSKYIKFNGIIDLEDYNNFSSNFNLKKSIIKNINLNNADINIKYDYSEELNILKNIDFKNIEENNNDKKNDENNNNIVVEKKVDIAYKPKINKNNNKINEYYSFPILINNNNQNEFIILKEIEKDKINKDKNKINLINENELKNSNLDSNESDDSINSNPFRKKPLPKKYIINNLENDKKYFAQINIKCLKKISDERYNMNFDIYKLNIF